MASSALIVNVVVTKNTRTVQLASFNIPVIFGPSNRFTAVYEVYTSVAEMTSAGFLSSDPEFIEATALMSQAIKPAQFVIGKFTAAVSEVDTLAVNMLTTGHQYKFTLNSVPISYTASGGDTQQSILAALLSAIAAAFPTSSPVTGAVTGTGSGALLTLTSTTPGLGLSYTAVDADLTLTNVTANHSIVQDIETLYTAITPNAYPYGVIVTSHVASDILQVAKYIETQLLIYVTATADSAVLSNAAGNVMAELMGLAYDRTLILYSAQANTNGPDGAWMGYMLPTTPGSSNWAMKTLVGVTPDNLTPTQIANILANNGNIYVVIGGNGTTLYGITPGGEYVDITIFLDWLASTIQTNIIAIETDPLNLKVPYTNQGIAMIESGIASAMKQGQTNGGLASGWSVFGPDISQYAPDDVTVTVGTQIVSGFQEGTFVEAERDQDTSEISTGSDGEATLVISPVQKGKIKITLQQASPQNDYFNTLFQALQQKTLTTAVIPVRVADKNGTTVVQCQQAVVNKPVKVSFADKPEGREWTFITGYLDIEAGGENNIATGAL
ncbi:unnamed protein product [Sphagnum balticum]